METLAALANFFEFDLVAHRLDGFPVGANEDDPRLIERLRETRALGQEAVAGMHGLRAGPLAGLDDLVDHKIGLRRGRRPDGDRLVGHLDVQGVLVGLGIDSDGVDPHATRSLDDPAGDFAAVGDENLLEHLRPRRGKRELSSGVVLLEAGGRVNNSPAREAWRIGQSPRCPVNGGQYQSQICARSQALLARTRVK